MTTKEMIAMLLDKLDCKNMILKDGVLTINATKFIKAPVSRIKVDLEFSYRH